MADPALSAETSWPIAGHDWAVHLLQQSADPMGEGPRHAYLLLGSPQIGKTTLALAFARSLLCTGNRPRPCGFCRACRLMDKLGHPDFRFVQPTDKDGEADRVNGLLRVDQASDIVREAMLHPIEADYKFFFIQDVHRANDGFSNKLLKTLEEPPEHVVLCLSAYDRNGLLPTIVSRCQVLELRQLDVLTIEHELKLKWNADNEQAALLARLSNGRLGWAVDQLQTPESGTKRRDVIGQMRQLVESNRVERLAFAQELGKNRNDKVLFNMLAIWCAWWRDVMLAQAGSLDACSNIDYRAEIAQDAKRFNPRAVRLFLNDLARIEGYLHHTVNTGLALDVLMLKLPGARSG